MKINYKAFKIYTYTFAIFTLVYILTFKIGREAYTRSTPYISGAFHLKPWSLLLLFVIFCSFSPKDNIILVNYHKEVSNFTYGQEFTSQCTEWQLDSANIIEIFTNSKITGFNEIDVRCSTLPCEYTGEVIYYGKLYYFWINAGGYTTLQNKKNESIYLIYDKKNELFLDTLWTPGEE